MKKHFQRLITQTLLCVLFVFSANAQVAVTYDSSSYTFQTCVAKNVTAQFTLPAGNHQLSIRDSINLQCGGVSSCSAGQLTLFHIVSSTPALTADFSYNTGTQSWVINLDSNISVSYTLNMSIKLDCGLIPCFDSVINSIKLFQKWSDPIGGTTFNVNGSGTNILPSPVIYPHFEEQTSLNFSGNYLDTVPVYHVYLNTGNAGADIQFSFNPSNSCTAIVLDSVKYAVGSGTPSSLGYANNVQTGWNTVFVPVNQSLVVRKNVIVTGCPDATCSNETDTFTWKCNYPDTVFCTECQHEFAQPYAIEKGGTPAITITRLLPDSATVAHDYSCMGTKEQWIYTIKNTGQENFHYALIELSTGNFANQLLLIDTMDINIQTSVPLTSWYDTKSVMTTALCGDTITAPLYSMKIYIHDFMKGDSVVLYFRTFRCCAEDEALFDGRGYGGWKLTASGTDSCGTGGFSTEGSINNDPYWDMQLEFFPVVSDLVVPQSSPLHGPSTPLLFIDEHSNASLSPSNYQLLGCSGTAASCGMHGMMQVHINCQQGLAVDTPLVHFINFPLDTVRTWNPVYYYTTHDSTTCDVSDNYYYFDLSDTNAFALLRRGRLVFRLYSCCGTEAPSLYTIDFALLADPSGTCDSLIFPPGDSLAPACSSGNCCFLPLARTGDEVNILCPGCLAPGIEVNSFSIQRINLGVRDSDNDGRADSTLAAIDSVYLDTYGTLMRTVFANHGDLLEDHMTGHFQDGDSSNGGYNYQQMLNDSAILNFIQLDRTFNLADSGQMNITPYYFKFYVDVSSANGNCVECEEFGADSNFKTIHIIEVNAAQMNSYVQYDTAHYRLFFTFDATSSDTIHNLYQNVVLHDPLFTGYRENQRYRMKTNYSVCGYFAPHSINQQIDNDHFQQAQIMNQMFLSGKQQPVNAVNSVSNMPNSISELNAHGWTFDTTVTGLMPVNQQFADSFLFRCAALGGKFYFYSDEVENASSYISETGNDCRKQIKIHPYMQTGGSLSAVSPSLYPYEYRLPSMKPFHCKARIPTGYTIDTVATIYSEFLVYGFNNGNPITTIPRNFIVHPVPGQDSVEIYLDTLFNTYPIYCLTDTVIGFSNTSLNLYSGDNNLSLTILINLHTLNCDTDLVYAPDTSDITMQFKDNLVSCGDSLDIKCTTLFLDPPRPDAKDTLKVPNPNFSFYFSPASITAYTHKICWNFTMSDYNDDAYNVFIIPQNVSYLTNWTIDSAGTTLLTPDSFGVFRYSDHLAEPYLVNYKYLCAQYDSCVADTSLNIYYGWNCNGYPSSAADTSLCFIQSATIDFTNAGFSPSLLQSDPASTDLCQPFTIRAELTNAASGSIYPFQMYLAGLSPDLNVLYVQFTSCNVHDTVTINGNAPYNITDSILNAIGITEDSTISLGGTGNCLVALLTLQAECNSAFSAGDTIDLPHIHILATTFCNDTTDIEERVFPVPPMDFQTIYSGVSHCNDCFTITKTALQDSVEAGDTATFLIIICGNNAQPDTVLLTEYLPSDFDTLPGSVIPDTVFVPAQGCDTIIVSGIFNTAGPCSDSSHINIVQITNANVDTMASACMTVTEPSSPCIALADTIIPNGALSSSYGTGFTGISIFIADTFFINSYFTISNCTVYTGSGAQIILVQSQGNLIIDSSTTITGCTDMWRGIEAFADTKLAVLNHSIISDADKGIYAHNYSGFSVVNSSVIDCITGIYTDPDTSGNAISCTVTGSTFGLFALAFKPDYAGQPQHGLLPEAGIELNDMSIAIIGHNSAPQNVFYNLNRGITGYRADIIINNTELHKIFADPFYGKPYDGTALVSRGDLPNHIAGRLTVNPSVGTDTTIHDCHRGIYTNYSNLTVSFTKFINLHTGIWSRHCSDLSTTIVSNCRIEASRYGIDWRLNAGAKYMIAVENQIIMSGDTSGTAINMEESNTAGMAGYLINNNYNIDIISAKHGIRARNVFNPVIHYNFIKQHSSGINPRTFGIMLNGCDSANLQCNEVNCKVLNYAKSYGLHVSESTLSTIVCNQLDSSSTGIYFGGGCGGTDLKGNIMLKNIRGLYLNGTAAIGLQKHQGNRWVNYTGPYGAININTAFLGSSKFDVNDPIAGTILYPYLPPYDSLWFVPDPAGHAFECGLSCTGLITGNPSDEYEKLIAAGKKLSVDYIPESKSIAKEYLFEKLSEDSAFLASDSIYGIFYDDQKNKATGKLYDVKQNLYAISWYDSLFRSLIAITDSLIEIKRDSIYLIDSLHAIAPLPNYDVLRSSLTVGLEILYHTKRNLFVQRDLFVNSRITDAEMINSAVITQRLPEVNRKAMNEMQVIFERYGEDSLAAYYTQISAIAQQCPYAGGPAVYIARTFVALYDDETEYDDDAVCLQSGIFKEENENHPEKTESEISIIPNPASDKIDIILNKAQKGICKIDILNALGAIVIKEKMNCSEKIHSLSTQILSPGIYIIQVKLNDSSIKIAKLIIER